MSTLDPALQTIFEDLAGAPSVPCILLEPGLGSTDRGSTDQGRRLLAVAQELERVSRGRITVSTAAGDQGGAGGSGKPPGLLLGADGRWPVRYLAVPEGPEARPFHHALLQLAGISGYPQGAWCDELAAMAEPASIEVFVAPSCPHCPAAVDAALSLVGLSEALSVSVIDAEAHLEAAQAAGARSVPRTVIDGELGLIGVVPAEALAQHLLSRGTAAHRQARLEGWITDGSFADAARGLGSEPAMRQAFAQLWSRSTLSSRLGLMMAVEEVLAADPRALDDMVPDLLAVLASDQAPLRGDTVDLLAQIGHPAAAAAIRPLIDDPDPDVAEAAAEALAELPQGDP